VEAQSSQKARSSSRGIRPVRGRVSGTIVCGVAVDVGWCCVDNCSVDEGRVAVDRRNDCCWRGDVTSLADATLSWAMNTSATYLVPAFAAD
jgi:hypothetical protein